MSLVNEWKQDYIDLWLNLKFETLKNLKQKRIIIVTLISIILPVLFYIIPVLSNNDLPDTSDQFFTDVLAFINLIIVLNAIFFGADAINSEKYSKTALLIYPLPQRRTSIFLGKFSAQLIASWIMITIFYLTTIIIVIGNYGTDTLKEDLVKSILFSFLYMTALLAGAFFLSSVTNNPASSMMFTFFIVFLLLPILSMLLNRIDYNTTWIITNYSSLITDVFRIPNNGFGPSPGDPVDFYHGVRLCVEYTMGLSALSWYYTMKQEV